MIVQLPFFVITAKSLPVANVSQVLAYAKANPEKLNFASVNAPSLDLAMVALANKLGGISYTTVPYRGGPEQQAAMISGEPHITIGSILSFVPLIKQGKVNAIMVTMPRRRPRAPEVPTANEAGARSFEAISYNGLWAPLGTAREIVGRLSTESMAISKQPDFVQMITNSFGAPPLTTTPNDSLRLAQHEIDIIVDTARLVKFEPR